MIQNLSATAKGYKNSVANNKKESIKLSFLFGIY